MAGDGIRAYAGEFLTSPAGLELSMNWCGFQCTYCFANAFKPDRRADLPGIMGLLANYRTRSTREAKLLQAGVPMLVSNHVDPFAGTNAEQFEPIWELCTELNIPLTWQTRGAHKPQQRILQRVIKENPPSVWYVSIPMLDDAVRKRVEPMAPPIESRFELLQQLVEAGHVVTVGVNPLTLDWVPDFEPLIDRIKASGAWGVWIEVPYFAQTFKANLKPDQVERLTPEFIKRCGEKGSLVDVSNANEAMAYAKSIGLQVFNTSYEEPTEFFDPWHDLYDRPMPYWHQLINVVDQELEPGDDESFVIITKADAMEILEPLPELDWAEPLRHKNAKHYRAITNPHGKLPKQDVAGFWDLIWNDEVYAKALGVNSFGRFAHASIRDGDTIIPLVDENGDRIAVYRRKGWKYVYADTPELVEVGELDEEGLLELDGLGLVEGEPET